MPLAFDFPEHGFEIAQRMYREIDPKDLLEPEVFRLLKRRYFERIGDMADFQPSELRIGKSPDSEQHMAAIAALFYLGEELFGLIPIDAIR